MKTLMLTESDGDIALAADILKKGGLVAFPTETVYGLGGNALDEAAAGRIFAAKGRPRDNPFIVHISRVEQLYPLVDGVPDSAKKLIDAFWPAPLTIVMKKSGIVPFAVTAGLDTVGVRMPKNETARRFIDMCGVPVAAPSANISGRPSPTSAEHVAADLSGRIDAIIDGGRCSVGVESTVVDVTGEVPLLLRPGGVTHEQLTGVLGRVDWAFDLPDNGTPRSPGIKYRHYSPDARVIVVRGDVIKYAAQAAGRYNRAGVIAPREKSGAEGALPCNCIFKRFGDTPVDFAANLFQFLRELEAEGAEVIFVQDIDCKGINLATRNRLYKAAGYDIIQEV